MEAFNLLISWTQSHLDTTISRLASIFLGILRAVHRAYKYHLSVKKSSSETDRPTPATSAMRTTGMKRKTAHTHPHDTPATRKRRLQQRLQEISERGDQEMRALI